MILIYLPTSCMPSYSCPKLPYRTEPNLFLSSRLPVANALKSENRESEGGAIGIRTLRRKKKTKNHSLALPKCICMFQQFSQI